MPKKITVSIPSITLEKDLLEGEEICPTCGGLGMMPHNNRYGLSGENHPSGKHFPYQKQSYGYCPTCYNGVVKRCKFCGEIGRKGYIEPEPNCRCEGAEKLRDEKRDQKERETWEKAEKISLADAEKRFKMLFLHSTDDYVTPDELADLIDDPDFESGYIYGTEETGIALNADDIVSDTCEELHEDAMDSIDADAIKELQTILDSWCEKHGGSATTYYPDYSVGIEI